MIIIITNRAYTKEFPGTVSPYPISFISNQIGENFPGKNTPNYTCKVLPENDNNDILVYPDNTLGTLLDGHTAEELAKPWVFYVHGNHQDPEENLFKCREIERIHKVNVAAFSWPSHAYIKGPAYEVGEKLIKEYIIRELGLSGLLTLIAGLVAAGITDLVEFWNSYPNAKNKALVSVPHLLAAIRQFNNSIYPNTGASGKPVLLVASLGNQLLKNTLLLEQYLPMAFSNIVLHQADIRADDHSQHLQRLEPYADNIFVTINSNDTTLTASIIRNKFNGLEPLPTDRMGTIQFAVMPYYHDDTHYIDLGEMECPGEMYDCQNEHEYYIKDTSKLGRPVVNLFTRLLKNTANPLPVNKPTKAGISKMPTKIKLYKPEMIIPYEDQHDPMAEATPSLEVFQDPLAPPAPPDPDLDD